jgi:hypothetical protein
MSMFGNIQNWINTGGGALINDALGVAGGVYSIDQGLAAADRMETLGNYLNEWSTTTGGDLATDSAFKGYGITTGLGTSSGTVNDDGSFNLNFGVSPDAQFQSHGDSQRTSGGLAMNNAGSRFRDALSAYGSYNPADNMNTAMTRSLVDPALREQEIYDRMMAMQNPELNRQQMAQQAREYAMGRGGVRSTMYGGTAEDAAMARARADASRQASVDAIGLARDERKMFGDMATQYGQLANQRASGIGQLGDSYANLGTKRYGIGMDMEQLSYLPVQTQLEILSQGMTGTEMAQQGQLTGQGFLSQMLLGGMGNNINAQKVANETRANLFNALLSNLGGSTGSDGSSLSGLGGLLSGLSGGANWLYNGLTGNGWTTPIQPPADE